MSVFLVLFFILLFSLQLPSWLFARNFQCILLLHFVCRGSKHAPRHPWSTRDIYRFSMDFRHSEPAKSLIYHLPVPTIPSLIRREPFRLGWIFPWNPRNCRNSFPADCLICLGELCSGMVQGFEIKIMIKTWAHYWINRRRFLVISGSAGRRIEFRPSICWYCRYKQPNVYPNGIWPSFRWCMVPDYFLRRAEVEG